jgi:hypothetical protein
MVAEGTGKGALALTVREGEQYEIGDFEIVGNQFFSTASIERFYPFGGGSSGFLGIGGSSGDGPEIFDQEEWEEATQQVRNLYNNNGYIYAQIAGTIDRRTTTDGRNVVDLRWRIREGQPAVINRILVRGNTVTHEDVIRRAIVMIPGDVMRQDALIRSYQNIANLGFFEQPMPPPDVQPANDQGDVDVIFNVKERHTGNINNFHRSGAAWLAHLGDDLAAQLPATVHGGRSWSDHLPGRQHSDRFPAARLALHASVRIVRARAKLLRFPDTDIAFPVQQLCALASDAESRARYADRHAVPVRRRFAPLHRVAGWGIPRRQRRLPASDV